jgi:hypothetical protein
MKKMRNRVLVGLAALAGAMALCSPPPVRAATARYGGGSYDGYDAMTVGTNMGMPFGVDNAGGATNVLTNGASLNGTLRDTGGTQTEVSVYWGPTNGETNKLAWTNRCDFGVCSALQPLTTNVTGLTPNTPYYYRFYATNAAGQEAWAAASTNFVTLGPPVVTTNAGADSIGLNTATLNGNLTAGSSAAITVYWGEDANTTSGSTNLGVFGQVPFSTEVSGLRRGTLYYYRCYATNAYGTAWSGVASFRTLAAPARYGGGSYDGYDALTVGINLQSLRQGTVITIR